MRAKLKASSLALLLLAGATIALPIAVQANEKPTAAGRCSDVFDQARREHCWMGSKALASDAAAPQEVVGHRHMHL